MIENRDIFQFPTHIKEAGIDLFHIENIEISDEFLIDMRTEEKKLQIRKNRPLTTLKLSIENYAARPRLLHHIVTNEAWKPCVYFLKNLGKVLLILDGLKDNTVDLNIYNDVTPYNLEHKVSVAKNKFECGMLATDISEIELDFAVLGLFFINNHSTPCQFTKIKFETEE